MESLEPSEEQIANSPIDGVDPTAHGSQSSQGTAKRAAKILVEKNEGFVIPTVRQRQMLLVEFAKRGAVIYGKAFDIVKLSKQVNLDDEEDVARNLESIVVYEIKSTKRPRQ